MQAFFAVIDGHGGCAAADYVAENLGKNIMKELEHVGEDQEHELQQAIRQGYSVTDKGFLSQVTKQILICYLLFFWTNSMNSCIFESLYSSTFCKLTIFKIGTTLCV